MSITDELRTWARDNTVFGESLTTYPVQHPVYGTRESLVAIADRIDEAYKHAIAYVDDRDPEMMAENGWIRLPVDADGVPIRVGDVVTMQLLFGGESKPLVVDRMELSHGRDGDLWCVALDTDKGCWNQPSLMRHYTPPTVEGVLREFADRVCNSGHQWGLDAADSIAEYAAKLRLAGEGE